MNLVFGIVYVFISIVLALDFYLNLSWTGLSVLLSIYLIGKGIASAVMKNSLFSSLDSVSGFYFLLLEMSVFPVDIFTVIFLIYLVQKGLTKIFRSIF